MEAHLRQQPLLLPEVLKTLFEIILFEECSNQWSLSRPMLSLILVNEAVYPELQRQARGGRGVGVCVCVCARSCSGRRVHARARPRWGRALVSMRSYAHSRAHTQAHTHTRTHTRAPRPQNILGQPTERQAHLVSCLEKLMTDVGRNLDAKNRDKFTQNLTIVRCV